MAQEVEFKITESTGNVEDMKAGECSVFEYQDGTLGLIVCCPQCGRAMGTKGHKYNPETQSVTPSIVHNADLGGCGWHGHITNGKFTT